MRDIINTGASGKTSFRKIIFCIALSSIMVLNIIGGDGDDPELFKSKDIIMLMEVPQKSGDFKSDKFWKGVPAAVMFNEASIYAWPKNLDWNKSQDLKAEFMLAYDADKLYLKAKVTDDKFVKRGAGKPESDQLELYIAANNSPTQQWGEQAFQLRIVPGKDSVYIGFDTLQAVSGSKCETRFANDGYTVFASIPWKSLRFNTPEPGTTLPFDFRVLDADASCKFETSMVWNNFPDKIKLWKVPTLGWGKLKFVKNYSPPYLAGERVIVKGAVASGPLKKDDHTLFLANFDNSINAIYAKGDPNAKTEKLKITSGNKGKYGEALKPISSSHNSRACSYALKNNFNISEGTIELYFNSLSDAKDSKFPYFWAIRSHPMGGRQINALSVVFDQRSNMINFAVSPIKKGNGQSVSIPCKLVKNKWNKLAVTWKNFNSGKPNASMAIYLNGKSQRVDKVKVDFEPPADARLFIGSSSNEVLKKAIQPGFMYVDELRISDTARIFRTDVKTVYKPKRTKDGKIVETRYLGCNFPLEKNKIDHIIQVAVKGNYNVVQPKVEPGMYKSDLSCRYDEIIVLDYDPLQYFIDQAHKHNLELIPFINVVRANQGLWLGTGFNGKYFPSADMAGTNAKNFIVNELSELAENYDIDGIALDYIRYGRFSFSKRDAELMKHKFDIDIHSFGKDPATSSDPKRLQWFKWRESNIDEIVKRTHYSMKKIDPDLILLVYVWNNRIPRIAQRWETWVDNNWIDRILLMNYSTSLGQVKANIMLARMQSSKPEKIDTVTQAWKGRWSDPGGLGKMTAQEMTAQIEGVREYGVTGTGPFLFDWNTPENFIALSKTVYKGKAVPAFRSHPRQKRQRRKVTRKMNPKDFSLKFSIGADDLIILPLEMTLGGIFLAGDDHVKIEYRNASGKFLPLIQGKPADDFNIPGYMTFPPIITDTLKVTPATKVIGVTRAYGISANAVALNPVECKIVTPKPGAGPGQEFTIAADGITTIDAFKGIVSGKVKTYSVKARDFAMSKVRGKGSLSFNLKIETAGVYELWMLVDGPSYGACLLSTKFGLYNSIWNVLTHGPYEWRCSSLGDEKKAHKYLLYQLEPGQYTLQFGWRQGGVKVVLLRFVPQ